MAVIIPEILSALLSMGIFSLILVGIFLGIRAVYLKIQTARLRRKLAGTKFMKAKIAAEAKRH